jgi:hypothetical protein
MFTSLTDVTIALSVRVTLFVLQHPVLTAVIGFAASVLVPKEFNDALVASGNPLGVTLGRAGQARARFFALVKSPTFLRWISRNPSASGRASQAIGTGFEDFLRKNFFGPGVVQQFALAGRRSVDFVFRGLLVEAKTSRTLGARELAQLEAIADAAKTAGTGFVYLFLKEPTPAAKRAVEETGGTVLWMFTK